MYQRFSANGTLHLGQVSDAKVGVWVIQVRGNGWTGSVAVRGRARHIHDQPDAPFVAVAYRDMATGDVAAAPINADALVEVPAAGLDIQLAVTVTAGEVEVWARPALG